MSTARSALVLSVLILLVVGGASYLSFQGGRATLLAGIEARLRQQVQYAGETTERSLAQLVDLAESWARQPVMVRIIDDDEDNEIAELLDTLKSQYRDLVTLACVNADGRVLASTDPRRIDRVENITTTVAAFERGLRSTVGIADGRALLTAPVFWQFDERELLGFLEVEIKLGAVLVDNASWWSGLVTLRGDVIYERGATTPPRGVITGDEDWRDPVAGRIVQRSTAIGYPARVVGPAFRAMIAERHDEVFAGVGALKSVFAWMTGGSAAITALLIVLFSRRQRVLMQHLAERTHELENANEDLTGAKAAALVAASAKGEFLANMSHEIRTPMTAILGFTEVLLDSEVYGVDAAQRIEAIQTIKRNGEHLLHLINDILDISKIESGKFDVEDIVCSPIEVVRDVNELMRIRADAKGLPFTVKWKWPIPETIHTDPMRLKQILINLVANAIKFTEVGGVRIEARLDSSSDDRPFMQFDIIDTGPGMSGRQAAKLFQPFVQADASTTREHGGTGLGLTISRRLAELLGGRVFVVVTEPGKGSHFRATVATGSLDNTKMVNGLDNASQRAKPDSAPAADTVADGRLDSRILYAEDGPDNQRLVSFVLQKAGADVTVVANGQLAVDAVVEATGKGRPFDVVLMDMQMPVLDGHQATRQLREKGYTLPIIALTARAMSGDCEKCINAGCDDYATKPIDRKELIATIRRHTKKQPAAV